MTLTSYGKSGFGVQGSQGRSEKFTKIDLTFQKWHSCQNDQNNDFWKRKVFFNKRKSFRWQEG
jgi:hypothetical protein